MFLSMLFLAAEAAFLLLFIMIQKSEKPQSFILWLTLSLTTLMAVNASVQGILNLIHLSTGILSMAIVTGILDFILICSIRKRGRQKLSFSFSERIFLILLTAFTVIFALFHYGSHLAINFFSVDAAVHTRYAKFFAFHHIIQPNMFYAAVNDGLLMEALTAFSGTAGYYHVFVFMRVLDLFLACIAFYACIEPFFSRNRSSRIILLLITFLYTIGYPLCSVLFGFAYYLACIQLSAYLYLVLRADEDHAVSSVLAVIMLGLGMFGTLVSYTLLVPVIWVFVFLRVIHILHQKGKLFTVQNFWKAVFIFLIPGIFGMAYSWINLRSANPGNGALATEGGTYFNLISNFLLLIPLITGEYVVEIRQKKFSLESFFFLCTAVYWFLFFILFRKHLVSPYYFSKLYNLLWLSTWIVSAHFISFLLHRKRLRKCIALTEAVVLCLSIFFSHPASPVEAIESVASIDIFNARVLKNSPRYSDDIIHLYEHAEDLHTDQMIVWASEFPAQWFKTFTDTANLYNGDSIDDFQAQADAYDSKYYVLFYEKVNADEINALKAAGTVIYKNEAGEIIQRD